MLTEARHASAPSALDTQLGLAIRRWCAPVLGLAPLAEPDDYVDRRAQLGEEEVNRRFLEASGIATFLLDTGYLADSLCDPAQMREASGARVEEVVRIEAVMDAMGDVPAAVFPDAFRNALQEASTTAVALKSIIAYRHGLDFDPRRPTDSEVVRAARHRQRMRTTDPVLLRFALWSGVDRGLPLQLHAGYGDPDLDLHRCDPLLLTPWLRATQDCGVDVMLLHCYPFHRHAGYLAQVFGHVYFDVSLAINHTGLRSDAVIAESLELAPFAKILFATDACGPSELHYLGSVLWRRGVSRVLSNWVESGELDVTDALRIAGMIGRENAYRVYALR
jgi:predicted TIM-barrel fold metal-dependent hydrolase